MSDEQVRDLSGYGQLFSPEVKAAIKAFHEECNKALCHYCNQKAPGSITHITHRRLGYHVCENCYHGFLNMKPIWEHTPEELAVKPRYAFTPDDSGYYYLDDGAYNGLVFVEIRNRVVFFKDELPTRPLDDFENCFYGAKYANIPDSVQMLYSGRSA